MRDDKKRECQLLLMMMQHPISIDHVDVEKGDFSTAPNQKIFDAMVHMRDNATSISPAAVELEIGESWADSAIGDVIENGYSVGIPVLKLCESVHNGAVLRRIQAAATTIAKDAGMATEADSVMNSAMDKLGAIDSGEKHNIKTLTEVFVDVRKKMEEPKEDAVLLKTGIDSIDDKLGGVPRGLLTIIAARPSMGKSTVIVNLIANMANMGKKVLFTSLEDGSYYIGARIISRFSGINSKKLAYQKMLNLDEWQNLDNAIARIKHENVFVDDSTNQKVSKIRRTVARMVALHDIDVVYIDHLGELADDNNEYSSTSANVRALRDMAKDFNIPVVLASQLNRSAEGIMPELSHLSASGKIEQVARCIWMLFRPHRHDSSRDENLLILNAAKISHGDVGEIDLFIDLKTMTIGDMSRYESH